MDEGMTNFELGVFLNLVILQYEKCKTMEEVKAVNEDLREMVRELSAE